MLASLDDQKLSLLRLNAKDLLMVLEKSAKEKQKISKNRPAELHDRKDLLIYLHSSAANNLCDFEGSRT